LDSQPRRRESRMCLLETMVFPFPSGSARHVVVKQKPSREFANSNLKVHKKRLTPTNAVFLTAAISVALSLIVLGSMTAFYGIVGVAQAAQAVSYILAISSVLYRRLRSPEKMPKARWSLGPIWGPVINILAIVSTPFGPGKQSILICTTGCLMFLIFRVIR
jgi:amino acid transporter